MARIRIVDEWLRSPASEPCQKRSVMVVAEGWAEQRVLMRAFAAAVDQTRPTIHLHGRELAIGPAGLDPAGPWGIHVEAAADGLAQDLRAQLELAAKRLAGSKGNPPRLADEMPRFETKPTNPWSPGSPADRQTPPAAPAPAPRPARDTSPLFKVSRPWESPVPSIGPQPVFERAPSVAALIGKTVPVGFQLTRAERNVLNALGKMAPVSAHLVADIAGVQNGESWMEVFVKRLTEHGLDVIQVSTSGDGQPLYTLRR